jgi:hypothetical protein
MATLALFSSSALSNEKLPKCDDANCTQQEMELIKIHSVQNSIYKVDHFGDIRRQAELFDIP